jgi:subtilisin-like proprotein convertase family protein
MRKIISFLSSLLLVAGLNAQVFQFDFSGINTAIPDGQPTGMVNAQTISSAPNLFVSDLNVSVIIAGTGLGGFNGDLYLTLQHDSGFSVLLNRTGRRTGSSAGYSDSGLNVTFDDSATRDIHNYRFELTGSHTTPVTPTGAWSPDARNIDPSSVLDGNSRSAFLDSFNTLPVNGTWSLFVSDLSSGSTHQLSSWSMEITAVPEPSSYAAVIAIGLVAFASWKKLSENRKTRT